MEISVEDRGNVLVLRVSGRIDHLNASAFHEALTPHLLRCSADSTPILLDLAGLEYISSAGLRIFMIMAKQVRAYGGRIAIAQMQPLVREIFEISHFHLVYEIFSSVNDALAAIGSTASATA
jgi:anti-anti-sigma factor